GSRFGPWTSRRRAASAPSRPFSRSVASDFITASADIACQFVMPPLIVGSATASMVVSGSVFIRQSGQAQSNCLPDRRCAAARQPTVLRSVRRTFLRYVGCVDTRALGHSLRMETLDILPPAQLGAKGQDGRGAGGHAEHECVLDMLSACECESH